MNKFSKVVLAAVVSLSAVAGAANASEFLQERNELPGATSEYGYGYRAGFVQKAAQQDGVNIEYARDYLNEGNGQLGKAAVSNPQAAAEVQSEIRQDPSLASAFAARGISVSNVVGSYQSLDGNTTYIVR